MKKIKITEIFRSIQGEGTEIGKPKIFIRVAGCNLRCKYCDTKFSSWYVDSFKEYTQEELLEKVKSFDCDSITWTGGEPTLYQEFLTKFMYSNQKFHYSIETNGVEHFYNIDLSFYSVSPKLENFCKDAINMESLNDYVETIAMIDGQLKFVISSDEDYRQVKELLMIKNSNIKKISIILQPEGLTENLPQYVLRNVDLVEKVQDDWEFWKNYNFRILPQYHRILWNNRREV